MFDSFTEPASVGQDLLRGAFSLLDRPAYALLALIYELFFNVATADVLSNEMVMKFYGRVQIVLGVFMMFQLAMTILRGIVNPDNFGKDNSTLITRIITALVLFALLMPIGRGGGNEFESQVNNNGLLFGTLYSLQHRLLSNNTIGRLVLGTNDSNVSFGDTPTATGDTELKKSARIFTSTILKGFYRINLVPEDQRVNANDGKDPAIYNDNRVCTDIDDSILAAYTRVDAEPGEILSLVNATCDSTAQPGFLNNLRTGAQKLTGTTKYIFTYTPVISTIVPIVFIFILLSFTIDVAVRAIKLAVLRLIAPIPIISYMDPKGSKDSSFNAWVKALTSTYLDLFIRLAAVYFVIYIIQDMIVNGAAISTTAGDGILHVLSVIIIFIGLFIFAKQAPKFIKQVLGLKDDGGKLFGGLGEIMGIGAVGAGAVGGAISKATTAAAGAEGGKLSKVIGNKGAKVVAGITGFGAGAIGGGVNAGKALWNSKDFDSKAVMSQVRAYNAKNYSNAADDSTPFGRFVAGAQANLGMKNKLQQYDDRIKYYGAAESAMKRITGAFDGNGDYKETYTGPTIQDSSGRDILSQGTQYSLKDYKDILNRVQATGDNTLIKSVDDQMKKAQGKRLDDLRMLDRKEIEARVNSSDAQWAQWTNNDLVAYDAARTIYDVAQKYSDDPFFSKFRGHDFKDKDLSPDYDHEKYAWGPVFKWSAGQAGKAADQIKNSNEYSQAKANAARAQESKK